MSHSFLIPWKVLLKTCFRFSNIWKKIFSTNFQKENFHTVLYTTTGNFWKKAGKFSLFPCCNMLFPRRPMGLVLYAWSPKGGRAKRQSSSQHGLGNESRAVLEAETKQSRENKAECSIFTLLCTSCYGRLAIYFRAVRMELIGTEHKAEAILLWLSNSLSSSSLNGSPEKY